jgi:outer membrane protein assembly factor BamE (lipoprotein component of BamABCDE complex)
MNRKICSLALGAMAVFASANAFAALDEAEKMYVDRMLKGSWVSLRDVAQSLYNTGNTNTEVLDVEAETLLERYQRSGEDRDAVDAVAWMCRSLGASGNSRYRPVLERIENDKVVHRKARGHCEKAAKGLPKEVSNPYTAGTVNLELLRNPPPPPPPPAPAAAGMGKMGATAAAAARAAAAAAPAEAPAPAAAPAAKKVDFNLIKEGMSQQEVDSLIGQPTAQTQRLTGKQWQPFNFGAKDLQRLYYLYKGVGRIEFSMKSGYEGVFRVIKVSPDPAETGYP